MGHFVFKQTDGRTVAWASNGRYTQSWTVSWQQAGVHSGLLIWPIFRSLTWSAWFLGVLFNPEEETVNSSKILVHVKQTTVTSRKSVSYTIAIWTSNLTCHRHGLWIKPSICRHKAAGLELRHVPHTGVPGEKVNILGGHSISHPKQKKCISTCVLFWTVSKIEPFHCTVPKLFILRTVSNTSI
jgi:hypothetical protein